MTILLSELFERESVEDIVINPKGVAFFEKSAWHGPYQEPNLSTGEALLQFARHIAEQASTTLGLTNPSVDSFIFVGKNRNFRAHVVINPLVTVGPEITLRRLPSSTGFCLADFSADLKIQTELKMGVHRGASLLIVGSTGSGKTSLLTALLSELPPQCRVLILEDSPEVPIPNLLSTKLLTRTNRFGFRNGATWDLSQLVFESLRMRPDRLILGECRGPEASAIATALQTGHAGLMTTLHSGSATQGMKRFDELVRQADPSSRVKTSDLWDGIVFVELNTATHKREIKELLWNPSFKV